MRALPMILVASVLAACGGGQGTDSSVGQTTKGDDLDVPADDKHTAPAEDVPPSQADAGVEEPPVSKDPVTFVIKNSGSKDLVFSIDRGWQPVIFGFSGKPPKAKPIIMFPKFCTASCDADEAERCPYCPQPKRVRDVRKAEKRETVEPGKTLEVPWDAQVHVYGRTTGKQKGRSKRCECYSKAPVPAESYTIRACGLRVTKSARHRSKLQCVDASMTMPSDGPVRVELDFPDPKGK